MPAPLAKGIIIGATIIVAAGIALYENPRVRQWVDQSRRKIAVALNGYDEPNGQSPHAHGSSTAEEEWRRHQDQLIRRRRSEIIRKARDQGVAVDLDELASVGRDDTAQSRGVKKRADSARSFDDLVGDDGMLRSQPELQEKTHYATTSSMDTTHTPEGFRARGRGEEALQRGSFFANPFADEEAMGLHDDSELIGASQEEYQTPSTLAAETPATLPAQSPPQVVAVSEAPSTLAQSQTLSIHSLPVASPSEDNQNLADTTTESFHSFASPARSRSSSVASGALTPTSEAFLTSESIIGSHADDIAVMSPSLHSIHHDDDSMSEAFSEIGDGQSTPGSWTDVGSEAGSEWDMNHRP